MMLTDAASAGESVPIIRFDGLGKVYQTRRGGALTALSNVAFSVANGEFISIVGPSGCGKSTLLMLAGGLDVPTSGQVLIKGEPITSARDDIGVVFQKPVLLPWKTVLENALLPIRVRKGDVEAYVPHARELLAMVGLSDVEDKYPFELSGGMQQRTALVRALVYDPDILLMDEPFGALDAMTRERLNVDIQRIWLESSKTVLFVTHSISEAVFLGDRVVVMGTEPGRVLEVVKVDLERPRSLQVMTTERFGTYVERIRQLFGVEYAETDLD